MADHDCPHIPRCEMYKLFRLAGTLETWQTRYCRADFAQCARHQLSQLGRPVPINLMPSGAYLKAAPAVKG